eukprot:scaffold1221_cov207-Amphora_coffeaeformis.AAC.62
MNSGKTDNFINHAVCMGVWVLYRSNDNKEASCSESCCCSRTVVNRRCTTSCNTVRPTPKATSAPKSFPTTLAATPCQ